MSKLRDIVREHKVVRENSPEEDAVVTQLNISYTVQQRIPNNHLLLAEDIGALLAHNDKCLRHELMYALVGDVHSELTILLMNMHNLRRYLAFGQAGDLALTSLEDKLEDIIKGLEI